MRSENERHTQAGAAFTQLVMATFRLNGALLRAGDELVRDLGISSARWQVLGAIHPQPRSVAQIARDMGLRRQGVQPTVNALAEDGLVEFLDNPHHRRAKLVALTPKGQRVFNKVTARQVDWANQLTADMSVQTIKRATSVLDRLRSQLDASKE